MKATPLRCVVDTNVPATANAANPSAPVECVAASAKALEAVMKRGHVFVDAEGQIMMEYRANLRATGQPGPGDTFLKWLMDHEWGGVRVTRVPITARAGDEQGFEELPPAPEGTVYDPSDQKFLAVAAAHPDHPPVLQSFDSKWWGWRSALSAIGVRVHFLCPKAIEAKYHEKLGK